MSASYRPSPRLAKLNRILSLSPASAAPRGADIDPGLVHLASVPLERIRALTLELQDRFAVQDDIDALAMRVLLNDYKMAVAQLRAVANSVDHTLRTASDKINRTRKALRREEEMAAKRAARDDGNAD